MPKNLKKTKGISNKNDAPKKHKKLQKLTKNRARGIQNGARMHQKWSQNREKCAESPKVATRWLPRPLFPSSPVDFEQFLGPPWEPKNQQKSIFSPKSRPRDRFFIDFCCECRFSRFQVDFGRVRTLKIVLPPRREHDFRKITIFTFSLLGTPTWTQNRQTLVEQMQKITKIAKKSRFFEGSIF